MPGEERYREGQPCWVELVSTRTDEAVAFYTGLFGWRAETPVDGRVIFSWRGRAVAGLAAYAEGGTVRDGWSVDLHVTDARATAAAAETHGATVDGVVDRGAEGTWVSLTDPTGAHIGAWQGGTRARIGPSKAPGTAVWEELVTRDFDTAVAFYRDVFGWETEVLSDTDDFRFVTLGRGREAVTGIEDGARWLPRARPSHWLVYFGVEDADRSAARVTELGGTVLGPIEDSAYGRLAPVADSTGATFSIMQVPA